MTKSEFNKIIADGTVRQKQFLIVRIETAGNPAPEIIINPVANYTAKVYYYNHAYDDDMTLIKAKEAGKLIKITDVIMTNNFSELNWFVY